MPRRDHDELNDWLAELGDPPGSGDDPPGSTPSAGPAGAAGPPAGEGLAPLADGDRRRGRPRRLWVLAALPWLVVTGLALMAWAEPASDGPPGQADGGAAAAGAGAGGGTGGPRRPGGAGSSPTAGADRRPAGAATPGAPATGSAAQAVPARLAAAAERAVRTVGARRLARIHGSAVHIDHARATAVTPLGGGDEPVRVVTVAALVRRADGDRWGEPAARRFGVAVGGDGRLRETPWPLPSRDGAGRVRQPAALTAIDVAQAPELVRAATAALTRAGYARATIQALHRVGDDRALRVEAVARAPGASGRGSTVVWLDAQAQAVLGRHDPSPATPATPPSRGGDATPDASPAPAPGADAPAGP